MRTQVDAYGNTWVLLSTDGPMATQLAGPRLCLVRSSDGTKMKVQTAARQQAIGTEHHVTSFELTTDEFIAALAELGIEARVAAAEGEPT